VPALAFGICEAIEPSELLHGQTDYLIRPKRLETSETDLIQLAWQRRRAQHEGDGDRGDAYRSQR
jgi:hypothetical protein